MELKCQLCNSPLKNRKAKKCFPCYLKTRELPITSFKKGEKVGDKHPRWTGGKWLYVRRECLKRDNYTCSVCGLKEEGLMDIDHIKPKSKYPELALELSNLQTICPNCHKRKSNKEAKITNTH